MEDRFSADFAEAQTRFRRQAAAVHAKLFTLPAEGESPEGKPLEVDVAWIGPTNPRRAVLSVSGLHGVEGFTGSAVQLDALAAPPVLPSDVALILVHVLNPWGMAWICRPNHDNVDLNRNFLLDGAQPETPPLYRRLEPLLNPPSPPSTDFFLLRLIGHVAREGFDGLQQVVAGGQYEFPRGLFYGGAAMTPLVERYLAFLMEKLAGVRRLVAVDIHTGLGMYGSDFLFVEEAPAMEKLARLRNAFGRRIRAQSTGGAMYRVAGSHLSALERLFPEARVDAVCQEFGCFPPPWMLKALRTETRWRLHGAGAVDHSSKRALLRMFNPPTSYWRSRVLNLGRERLNEAAALLDG